MRTLLAGLLLGCAVASVTARAAGFSLQFAGTGSGDVDRVKIRVDDPAHSLPGPPADVGASDFTLEFWVRGTLADNPAGAISCGANVGWINGNIVLDRDRYNQDRKFGVSLGNGRVVFGVSGEGSGDRTICGTANVLDNQWHHVAVQRRRSDGYLWVFVDGAIDAQGDGPDGDISYPDDGVPGNFCGGPCTNSDPFLVIGAEKHDAGPAFPPYRGRFDELRISNVLRYAGAFPRPRAPFRTDLSTVALYHFDEGSGFFAVDTSGAAGGPSPGLIRRTSVIAPPTWSNDSPFVNGAIALNATIRLSPIASGLSSPVDIVAAPGDGTRLFVVEQGGAVRILRDGLVLPTPFLSLAGKTTQDGERGFLAMTFHPDYAQNRRLFVFYTRSSDGALIVERYERYPDQTERVDPASGRVLMAIPHSGASNHNGGKITFGIDGYLYIATGDGGGSNDPFQNGQNFGTRLGKVLRVDPNVDTLPYYAVPPTNPFVAQSCNGAGTGVCPEIWSLGLRNPWRISIDRLTGDMFIGDVGQGAREEIDYEPYGIVGGRNYGWRILEGFICTPAFGATCTPPPNYVPPIVDYPRSQGQSVTGGFRYRGSAIPPLASAYLYADYISARMWAATDNGTGVWTGGQQLMTAPDFVSTFGEDNAGELYVALYTTGVIHRIDPIDADSDGLPDWWEATYFGSTTGANAAIDSDGDAASNLAEFLARTDPLNAQSVPSGTPGVAPEITSPASLVCVIGAPCSLSIVATGTPLPGLNRSGSLPSGVTFNATTRVLSGTAGAGTVGTYPQTFTASNGFGANAVQVLNVVVVAGCGGFSDVAPGDGHCNSVEWLRNRAIAQGCTGTQYCPAEVVIRASMALFQNRLGLAVTPQLSHTEGSPGGLPVVGETLVCSTGDLAAVGFPRNVEAHYALSGEHTGALTVGVTLMMSRNGGATWDPVTITRMRTETAALGWRSAQGQGGLAIAAGDTVRFALKLDREAGVAALANSRCQITTLASTRDGAAPPRDVFNLIP